MLFMYELHRVHGTEYDAFEAAYRNGWLPALATEKGARLLWFFNVAHGANVSFNVVTITGLEDLQAWERLALRVQRGDLQAWAREADRLRYGVEAGLLRPTAWSPLQQVDLDSVSTTPQDHSLQMYVQDTVRPDTGDLNSVEEAVRLGSTLAGEGPPANNGKHLSELTAAFRPLLGAGRRREIVLLQKLLDLDLLARYYQTGEPPQGAPWSAQHRHVPFTDTWQTRILRAAAWSPLN